MTTPVDKEVESVAAEGLTARGGAAGNGDVLTQQDNLRTRAESLNRLKAAIVRGPSVEATRRQRARGKLTVRERIDLLFDEGTFVEIEAFRRHRATSFGLDRKRPYTDGVVAGWGLVFGRKVFVYAHDFRIFGGALGEAHAAKIHKVMDMAVAAGAPLVSLCDGAGARIQEGVTALAGYGGIFRRNTLASGVIPQISVILGPCAGGAAYSPALTDFVFMVRDVAQMFITGPDVVEAVTGERIDMNGLGGADVHASLSGVATFVHDDEESCIEEVRYLLSLLPPNNRTLAPVVRTGDPPDRRNEALLDIVPVGSATAYDMHRVIEEIVDHGEYLELHEHWARNLICALARMDGRLVGIVANQPLVAAGALDIDASAKGARFVQMCDAFSIPLITLVDVPGFLPGREQEHNGIIRHGAKLLYAYCAASVPRIQLVLRKAYGGAYIVLDSRSIGADLSLAWPTNEIAVMGPEGAANIIFRREIAGSPDPERTRAECIEAYREELMHPYYAAERGLVDDVIDPATTRQTLIRALDMLEMKHAPAPARKHGNPPM
ncbi:MULTISPECIES: acyl-CoA carboxylase subunit beta [Thermomonospora]|uniref:Carboxyl transferase n=1 Tax=Thermomonospora curvata (strain ATCC 19995 / DSM 43183 / JCM 3096 / KCTC 9072 / NBRC 15933 / NCIMB 10081 / Henssen B9) TaxID=471852 RepID=D1A6R3_THECD|nr:MULTISPECIES: acyl-CoA carboxylase subunit beta [Thermomonospora]ACY98317.1 carboxyl transferase [Thermomonospora curvata DSM 43183]PKK13483.1 MAG: acyl-CoA carboxylase subunit beta [Thermomonospora sp. CIF 1]